MMKGDKMVKKSSFGGIRKRLSDITNMNSQHRSPAKEKENMPAFEGSSTKNYIEQLLKENAAMMKLIQERDKVIESTGLEMQKLRVIVQKTQLQNWQLAQSNSQMLAELNVGKDRLKALQHELACKDALFKAKIAELEEKAKMQQQTNGLQENANTKCETNKLQGRETVPTKEVADQPLQDNNNNASKMARTKKRQPARSRSMGPTTSQQAADKEMAENKRRCLRRQSVRLKQHEEGPQVDLLEIDVANFPMSHQHEREHEPPMDEFEGSQNITAVSIKEEGEGVQPSSKDSETARSSLGRPLRRAAAKVQSYKEPTLCLKMRRP